MVVVVVDTAIMSDINMIGTEIQSICTNAMCIQYGKFAESCVVRWRVV